MAANVILEAKGLTKTFGSARVLDEVNLTLHSGEVVALLGENGSGKSTLTKILGGVYAPDPGASLRVGGRDVGLPMPAGEAQRIGLSFVHQDLGLARDLTVLENLYAGERTQARGRDRLWIGWRAERERTRTLLVSYNLDLDPDTTIEHLLPVERAMLAIVRAVEELASTREQRASPGVLVLDEPTAFLGERETTQLFDLVRQFAAEGGAVILVTHYIADVRAISDRVVVLRDGRLSGQAVTREIDDVSLVDLIVGGKVAARLSETARRVPARAYKTDGARAALTVEHLSGPHVYDVSFGVSAGEVLGMSGVRGSGFDRVPYLITGANRAHEGSIVIGMQHWDAHRIKPRDAVAGGVALVPADRAEAGGAMELTVAENIAHFRLGALFRAGRWLLKRSDLEGVALARIAEFDIRPRDPHKELGMLSGGNQQKVVLAKWLEAAPDVLLLHEPTQGVDIGARSAIYEIVAGVVDCGGAVVWFSDDYEELAQECDRVLIMNRGRVVDELATEELSEDTLRRRVYHSALEGSTSTEDFYA